MHVVKPFPHIIQRKTSGGIVVDVPGPMPAVNFHSAFLRRIHGSERTVATPYRYRILYIGGTEAVTDLHHREHGSKGGGDSVIEIDWILPQPRLQVRVQHEYRTENVAAEGEDQEHAADSPAGLGTVALDYLRCKVDGEEECPEDAGKPAKRLYHRW